MDTSTKQTILVVEDEKNIRKLLKRILDKAGYSAATAETGEHALEYLQTNNSPDMIVLDMNLPKLSGAKLFKEIQKISPTAKILVISGMLQDDEVRNVLQQGAIDFLQKPYDNKAFLAKIKEHI